MDLNKFQDNIATLLLIKANLINKTNNLGLINSELELCSKIKTGKIKEKMSS